MTGTSTPGGPAVVAVLRAAGCVFAEEEAELLLAATEDPVERAALVARRVAGEPLEQVLGWAAFEGLRLAVMPGVFVPRRRTGLVVRTALELAAGLPGPVVAVYLCCGTGAVGAALAAGLAPSGRHGRALELHASDVDPAAVACAVRNLAGVGQVHAGDLFAALPDHLRGRVDLVLANAPYVPTAGIAAMPREARDHEPPVALDGGADGLDLHRRIAADAGAWLSARGHLVIETSRAQAAATAAAVRAGGLVPEVRTDDELDGTVVVGSRAAG